MRAAGAHGARLEFGVLGTLEVCLGGRPIPVRAPKQRALLALLLLHANESISNDRLIDQLWGERPPRTVSKALQVHVSELRKLLETGGAPVGSSRVILTGPSGYLIRVEPGQLDLHRFLQLADEGRTALSDGDAAEAARLLGAALALWRGEPLAELARERFASSEIGRLEGLRLAALEDRIEAELALGEHAQLVSELETLAAKQPLRERLQGQLIVALYRSGRQADALAAYRKASRLLAQELGVEPTPTLRQLERAILTHDPALRWVPSRDEPTSSLPKPPTSFVGRREECARLSSMLRQDGVRLLTLSGPGGIGKTRLALEVARELEPSFSDGAIFLDLESISDPGLLAPALARALGLREGESNVSEALTEHLRSRSLMLVLDTFEHLLPAASLLSELLTQAPGLKLLVTSRALLRLSGEHEFPVPPLDLPPEDERREEKLSSSSSVALFAERARAVDASLELAQEDFLAIAAICRRLEGLPLSLELAAARTRLLSPSSLLDRLEGTLDLLTTGPRDAPARHRTLRATVDWSYRLLDEAEQGLFARLGIFVGGFTLEAAEAICARDGLDVLPALDSLVGNSLLRRQEGSEPRFRMLDAVREYAGELLETIVERPDLRRLHARWYLELAEGAERELQGPQQSVWLDRLEREHGNVRAALAFALEHEPASAVRLGAALRRFWEVHGHLEEGRGWLEAVLALDADVAPELRTKVLTAVGGMAGEQGDMQAARRFFQRGVTLARQAGLAERLAHALNNLAWSRLHEGDLERARRLYQEALRLHRESGQERGAAIALEGLAGVAVCQAKHKQATALLAESEALARRSGDTWVLSFVLRAHAHALMQGGDAKRAARLLTESLALSRRLGDLRGLADDLEGFAGVAEQRQEWERAGVLVGAAALLRESTGATRPRERRVWYESMLARLGAELSVERLEGQERRGRALPLEEAVALALGAEATRVAAA